MGSLPAACAHSSMKDWNTKQNALLRGARIAKVGTPIGMVVAWNLKFGTKPAGNSFGGISAALANFWPSPKLTKWFCHAVILPPASTPAFK